jgi:hypothetical protein
VPPRNIRQYARVTEPDVEAQEREERQYALMRACLAGFRLGDASIGPTITGLEGLLHQLEHAPEDWKDRFIEEWSVLEIAYAVALDRQQPMPTAASDYEIREALDAMDALIEERSPRT